MGDEKRIWRCNTCPEEFDSHKARASHVCSASADAERATSFSFYGGSAGAFESAHHLLMKHATAAWENDSGDLADALKKISRELYKLGVEERKKQQEYA